LFIKACTNVQELIAACFAFDIGILASISTRHTTSELSNTLCSDNFASVENKKKAFAKCKGLNDIYILYYTSRPFALGVNTSLDNNKYFS